MPWKLFTLYQRKRIININVNIIAAGLVAIGMGAGIVELLRRAFPDLPTIGYTAIGTGADIVCDVSLYFALHWVANHWRPIKSDNARTQERLDAKSPPFWRDASLVQFERAILSPLYYLIASGGMEGLQRSGFAPAHAMLFSYTAALAITRVLHTLWGLKTGRF